MLYWQVILEVNMKTKKFRNLTAKYARGFNKCSVQVDRKRAQKLGKVKHKKDIG